MPKVLFRFIFLSIDLWINGILALIAVVGFITSLIFSIKSNNNLKQQTKLQNHPILKFKVDEEKRPQRILVIENIGTGVAMNVIYIAGVIDEQIGLVSIKPDDPKRLGSLAVNERTYVDESDEYSTTFMQYAKENTNRKTKKHSIIYYDDIFGNRFIAEAELLLEFVNIQLINSSSPRELSTKELESLIKEMSKEESTDKKQGKVRKELNNIVDKVKKIAGGRK